AVRLDREFQDHLTLQRRVLAQLAVVQAIERRFVAIEHDLDLFVGARERGTIAQRSVAWADRADVARGLRERRALNRAALRAALRTEVAAERGQLDAAAPRARLGWPP